MAAPRPDHDTAAAEAPCFPSDPESHGGTDTPPEFPPKEADEYDDARVDGWRGWVVVAAAACSLFVFQGVIYSWGILQSEIADTTGASLTSLTFVGSLATSFMCSICIFVGKAIRRFGYRETALAGAVLLGLGEFLSSWVVGHLGALFVTHGVLFGVGGGLTVLVRCSRPFARPGRGARADPSSLAPRPPSSGFEDTAASRLASSLAAAASAPPSWASPPTNSSSR